jgi:hypothetical protein
MTDRLLDRCPHCGVDPMRVILACQTLRAAARFLGEGKTRVVAPSLEYESGALHALEWALGVDPEGSFEAHVQHLERIRDRLSAQPAV